MDKEILAKYRKAGKIAGKVREYGLGLIKEGTAFLEVANAIEKKIVDLGGNIGLPTNIAINEQAAHYTPCIADELRFR